MNKKSVIYVTIISLVIFSIFFVYGLTQKDKDLVNDNAANYIEDIETSKLSIGSVSEAVNVLNTVSNYYHEMNSSIEVTVNEDINENLFEALLNNEYDFIITSQKIDELQLGSVAYEELLFGVINDGSETSYLDNLLYCYILSDTYQKWPVREYLKLYYSQPLTFVNTEDVYALEPTLYEEILEYLELLELYPQ